MYKRFIVGIVLLPLAWVMVAPGLAAPMPQSTRAVITFPESNATLSGLVEVRGIAMHPSAQWWYDVTYAPGPEPRGESQWVSLAQGQNSPIDNDVLATWDTTSIPDGVYVLALTVKGDGDPTYWQWFVTNLTVNNADAQATATSEATPEPLPTVGGGPTSTPVSIEQPATSTPTATPGLGSEDTVASAPGPSEGGGQTTDPTLNTSVLQEAFCTGGWISIMLFLLWGLYMLAKLIIRWYVREGGKPLPFR